MPTPPSRRGIYNKAVRGTSGRSKRRQRAAVLQAVRAYAGGGTWDIVRQTPSELVLCRVGTDDGHQAAAQLIQARGTGLSDHDSTDKDKYHTT